MDRLQQIKALWIGFAEFYREAITPNQIRMYAEQLAEEFNDQEIAIAMNEYKRNPENTRMPLPAQLMASVRPKENENDIGRVCAGLIITAIGKFGSYRSQEAREFMGELAWSVVTFQGGWQGICGLDSDTIKAEQPRWRDMAMSLNKRAKLGTLHTAPALPKLDEDRLKKALEVMNVSKTLRSIA